MKLMMFAFLIISPSCLFFDSTANNQVSETNSNNVNSTNNGESNNGKPEHEPIINASVGVIFKRAVDVGLTSLGKNNFALVSALGKTIRVEVLKNDGEQLRSPITIKSTTSTISVASKSSRIFIGTDNELYDCTPANCQKIATFHDALEVKVAVNRKKKEMALLIRYKKNTQFAYWDPSKKKLDPTPDNHALANGAFKNLHIIATGDTFLATAVRNRKLVYFYKGRTIECDIASNPGQARGLVYKSAKPISIFPGPDFIWQNSECNTGNNLMFNSEFDTHLDPYDLTNVPTGEFLIAGKATGHVLYQIIRPEVNSFKYISSGSVSDDSLEDDYDKLEVALNKSRILIVFLQKQGD